MATAGEVLTVIQEVEAVASTILSGVAALDPGLALPVAAIADIEGLANAALAAWAKASGVAAPTVTDFQALTVDLHLDAPTA